MRIFPQLFWSLLHQDRTVLTVTSFGYVQTKYTTVLFMHLGDFNLVCGRLCLKVDRSFQLTLSLSQTPLSKHLKRKFTVKKIYSVNSYSPSDHSRPVPKPLQ